jgi:PleD family two-component response regulator
LGVACFPEDADSPEALIQQADIALYSAKLHGKDRVVVFERH